MGRQLLPRTTRSLTLTLTNYQELGTLAESYRFSYIVDAITILVIAVKAIKYFALQHDLALLKGTLAQATSTCTHHAYHGHHAHHDLSLSICIHQAISDLSLHTPGH